MPLLGLCTFFLKCEIELWRVWNKKGDRVLDNIMLLNIAPVFLTETVMKERKKWEVMAWLSDIGSNS